MIEDSGDLVAGGGVTSFSSSIVVTSDSTSFREDM